MATSCETKLNTLKSDVVTVKSDVTTVKTKVSQNAIEIDKLKAGINQIIAQIGGTSI